MGTHHSPVVGVVQIYAIHQVPGGHHAPVATGHAARGKGGRTRGIVLHDPPPGYHPPRPRIPLKERQREAREDFVLMRVATIVVVLAAAAIAVIFVLMIAGYH